MPRIWPNKCGTARFYYCFSFDSPAGQGYYAALMFDTRLPVHIDPFRMAETRRLLEGKYALNDMTRLGESLQDTEGEVSVSLEFGIDNEGIRFIRGRVQAEVSLICQRCLEVMRYPIDSEFVLGLVRSMAEAEALPSHYEPLVVDDEPQYLRDIIEDELLLALPIVAMHEQDACRAELNLGTTKQSEKAQEEKDTGAVASDSPFAVLADLKKDRKR